MLLRVCLGQPTLPEDMAQGQPCQHLLGPSSLSHSEWC